MQRSQTSRACVAPGPLGSVQDADPKYTERTPSHSPQRRPDQSRDQVRKRNLTLEAILFAYSKAICQCRRHRAPQRRPAPSGIGSRLSDGDREGRAWSSRSNEKMAPYLSLSQNRLDANNANTFKRAMEPVLADAREAVLDMSSVRFMDSSGLGALLSCLRRLTAAGGALKLCALQKPVRSVMEMVRMHRVFDIYDTRNEALAARSEAVV
ncbi:MAG: STAS domain-containing protein [Armatimonadetes bacterium]|nr:STAS domain-containing protein [Armatimonadota bacterium]